MPLKHGCHRSRFFGNLINHGLADRCRALIAGIDAPFHFFQVASAQQCEQPALTEDFAIELLLRIRTAVARLD